MTVRLAFWLTCWGCLIGAVLLAFGLPYVSAGLGIVAVVALVAAVL